MSAIRFADTQLELQGDGLAWFPEHSMLCASDIHFEKGSFFQRFSTLLPPYDTRATLSLLTDAVARLSPRIIVSLGDAFHDNAALTRMHNDDRAQLEGMIAVTERWLWVEGNHDAALQGSIGGERCDEFRIHNIVFRHITEPASDEWELSGHYHPKARVAIRGHTMRLPCFVLSGKRLLMPAIGSYTGGLDVTSEAISEVMPLETRELFLLHNKRIFGWRESKASL